MIYLLDTNTFIFASSARARLSTTALATLSDPSADLLLSDASCWEMAIKAALGKLDIPDDLGTWIDRESALMDVDALQISRTHVLRVARLPHHHRDPFDRLLVAQALCEDIPIISIDPVLDAYGVDRIW